MIDGVLSVGMTIATLRPPCRHIFGSRSGGAQPLGRFAYGRSAVITIVGTELVGRRASCGPTSADHAEASRAVIDGDAGWRRRIDDIHELGPIPEGTWVAVGITIGIDSQVC